MANKITTAGVTRLIDLIGTQTNSSDMNTGHYQAITTTTFDPATNNGSNFSTGFDIFVGDGASADAADLPVLAHDIDVDGFRASLSCRYWTGGTTTGNNVANAPSSSHFGYDFKGVDVTIANDRTFSGFAGFIRGFGTVKLNDVNIAFVPRTGSTGNAFGSSRVLNHLVVYDWTDVTFTTPGTRAGNVANIQMQGIQTTSTLNRVAFDGNIAVEFPQGLPQYNTVWGSADFDNGAQTSSGITGLDTAYSFRLGRPQNNNNTHSAGETRWTVLANNDMSNVVAEVTDDDVKGLVARGATGGADFGAGLYTSIFVNSTFPDGGVPLIFSLGSLNADQDDVWVGNTVKFDTSIADSDTDLLFDFTAQPADTQIYQWTLADTRVDPDSSNPVYTTFTDGEVQPTDGFFLRNQQFVMQVGNTVRFVADQIMDDVDMSAYTVTILPYKYLVNDGYALTLSDSDIANLGLDDNAAPEFTNTTALTVEVDNRLTTTQQDTKPLLTADVTTTSEMYATVKLLFQTSATVWPETANTTGVTVDLSGFDLQTTTGDSSISGTTISLKIPLAGISGAIPDTPGDDYEHTTTFVVDSIIGTPPVVTNNALIATGNTNIVGIPTGVAYAIYDAKGDKTPNSTFGTAAQTTPTSTALTVGTTYFIVAAGGEFITYGQSFTVPDTGVITLQLDTLMETDFNYIADYQDGVSESDFSHILTFRADSGDTDYLQLQTTGFITSRSTSQTKYIQDAVRTDVVYLNAVMASYDSLDDSESLLTDDILTALNTERYQITTVGDYSTIVLHPDNETQDYFVANPAGQYADVDGARANVLLNQTVVATIDGVVTTITFNANRIAEGDLNLAISTIRTIVNDSGDDVVSTLQGTRGANATLSRVISKVGGLYGLV